MSTYDDLVKAAKEKKAEFRRSANDFVPKMYNALRAEEPNMTPADARDRIEKDLVGVWEKRTILAALPAEAKNQVKSKAAQSRKRSTKFAAESAAPGPEIIIDSDGHPVDNLPWNISSSNSQGDNKLDGGWTDKEEFTEEFNEELSDSENVECFEFLIPWEEVHNEVQRVFSEKRHEGHIHFFAMIDMNSRAVVTAGCGKPSL